MAFLIALTGIFFFPMQNMTDIPQATFFIFSSGIVLSIMLLEEDALLGGMLGWVSIIFLYTILFKTSSKVQALDCILTSFSLAMVYLSVKKMKMDEDLMKWFLIPAAINIIFIFIQKFIPNLLPIQAKAVCGLLGNAGLTATFLGMTTGIFLRYMRFGLPFLFLAIVFCDGFVGMVAFVVSCIIYNWGHNKKIWIPVTLISILAATVSIIHSPTSFMLRLSMWAGTFEGILRHPFMGWGMGSFIEVMAKVPMSDSYHFGVPFNNENYMMNHPANEFLFGWWNFGLPFVLLMAFLTIGVLLSFDRERLMTYCVLVSGLITVIGFRFTPPTLFMMVLAFGMFENKMEVCNARENERKNEYSNV